MATLKAQRRPVLNEITMSRRGLMTQEQGIDARIQSALMEVLSRMRS
jgi:hypothetical protein